MTACLRGDAAAAAQKSPAFAGLFWCTCDSYASGIAMELLDRVVEAAVARFDPTTTQLSIKIARVGIGAAPIYV
jgi:hypothetical protein